MENPSQAAPSQAGLSQANSFELTGKSIHVSYSSSSFAGQPMLSYRDNRISRSFSGNEIRSVDTELGRLITVTLDSIADGDTVTFSLALPVVTVRSGPGIFIKVPGITVTNPSTIAGPPPGPQKLYAIVNMRGTAQAVNF
jgi:hypothetical protein